LHGDIGAEGVGFGALHIRPRALDLRGGGRCQRGQVLGSPRTYEDEQAQPERGLGHELGGHFAGADRELHGSSFVDDGTLR
jgi:hypothetical protein